MRINENIKRLRERQGLSQLAFAKLCGMEEIEIQSIEESGRDVLASQVYKIADATGVTAAWLMDGREDNGYTGKYDAVLRVYNRQDRLTVMGILAMNGYDVGQHKAERTKTGKVVDYFIHAKLLETNADTSR